MEYFLPISNKHRTHWHLQIVKMLCPFEKLKYIGARLTMILYIPSLRQTTFVLKAKVPRHTLVMNSARPLGNRTIQTNPVKA